MISCRKLFRASAFAWFTVALVFLLGATSCTLLKEGGGTQRKNFGGTSDPIEGKFATVLLGRTVGAGLPFPLPDGRTYSLTLVKTIAKDGTEEYFVSDEKDGVLTANSVSVPKPTTPFRFSLTPNGTPKAVTVWLTEGISVPFESVDNSLQGTGLFVERLVKIPGDNGRGSVLLFNSGTEADRTLVNVYQSGSQEVQSTPGPATESVVNSQLRYSRTAEAGQTPGVDFMEINSQTGGKVGFVNASGQETFETGPVFALAPRILEPTRHQRVGSASITAKWEPVPDGRGNLPPAHKIWFAEIVRVNGAITRPPGGAFFEYIVPTSGFQANFKAISLNNLAENKFYRVAVASCDTADCSRNLKWAMVDFFGPLSKPAKPIIVGPAGNTSPFASVPFNYRSLDQAAHDLTTHFEIWGAIYRNGTLYKRLTDVSQRTQDLWAPVKLNELPSIYTEKVFSHLLIPESVGDTLNFQVRACADIREYTTVPRACSDWVVKTVTIQNP